MHIDVINHFGFNGSLCKEDSCSATESFCIELVSRYEWQYMLKHRLLATIVSNRGFHLS